MTNHLTPEQVRLFRHNGFVKLPGRLPGETVAALKEAFQRHIREEIAPIVRDKQGRIVRISDLWGRGTPFREALTCPEVLDPLEDLLGPNIDIVLNRHNHATLRLAGDGTAYFHRDVLQWSRSLVTVLFYLEDTTVENGCTWVIPGTHLLLSGVSTNSVENDAVIARSGVIEQAVPVPMPAGGLLAIDSFVMHSAGENRTQGTRMSMTMGYHSVDELSGVEDSRRALVRGERTYGGNDRGYR